MMAAEPAIHHLYSVKAAILDKLPVTSSPPRNGCDSQETEDNETAIYDTGFQFSLICFGLTEDALCDKNMVKNNA